jgi:hypothetical protein
MSKVNSKKLSSIISDINSFYDKIENISDLSKKEFESIKSKTLTIIEDTKLITLPSNISTKLNTLSLIVNGHTKTLNDLTLSENGLMKTFEYTPVLNNKKYFTKDNGVIAKFTNVSFGKVLGVDKRHQGLIDDISDYDGKSILSLIKNPKVPQKNYLHNIDIRDKYSTLFDFRLNRFPVKTHNKKGITKQYTSRRSDLISFNYESVKRNIGNSISFGAMAPYGVNFSEKIPPIKPNQPNQEYFLKAVYQKSYSPFSIAASITYEKNKKLSVYTDYKFELGKFYNVRLDVEYVNESKEYIEGFKNVIDTTLTDAKTFVYDGVTYSIDDVEKKVKPILESLREQVKPFEYALKKSQEYFTFENKNYNTIQDAQVELDNFIQYSEEYSNNFNYVISTAIETFSINGATYNTIQDAQDYWVDYRDRFNYAIDTANEKFTYAGYNYNTIQDAAEERQKRLNVLTQLKDDWDYYQDTYDISNLRNNSLFTDNDLPVFKSTYTSGTTSNTLTYNSIMAVESTIASRRRVIDIFSSAIEEHRELVDNDNFVNNPITFDGVTYTTTTDEETARKLAQNELYRLEIIYNDAIKSRVIAIDEGLNYYSNSVTYDNVTYTIKDAYNALENFNGFSKDYTSGFEKKINLVKDNVNNGIYSSSSFMYDGISYSNDSDSESYSTTQDKLDELLITYNNYNENIKYISEIKSKEFESKIKNNKILVSYSGEIYSYNDALKSYRELSVLLSGYGKFGKNNLYKFTLYVDGKKQRISSTLNKVWGDKAKFLTKRGLIAKRPGFNKIGSQEVLYHLFGNRKDKEVAVEPIPVRPDLKKLLDRGIITDYSFSHIVKKLEFGKLVSIDTVPYKVKFKNNFIDTNSLITNIYTDEKPEAEGLPNEMPYITKEELLSNIKDFREVIKKYNRHLKLTESTKYKKLYNNYLYKTNNGVDFGDISVYYSKQKPKLSIIALDQNKLYGDEFIFEGTEFKVKGLMKGDSVDSVTLSSIGTTEDIASTHTGTPRPVVGSGVGIIKDGYLIRPSNAQGTGLDKYDIHYNIGILRVYQDANSKEKQAPLENQ